MAQLLTIHSIKFSKKLITTLLISSTRVVWPEYEFSIINSPYYRLTTPKALTDEQINYFSLAFLLLSRYLTMNDFQRSHITHQCTWTVQQIHIRYLCRYLDFEHYEAFVFIEYISIVVSCISTLVEIIRIRNSNCFLSCIDYSNVQIQKTTNPNGP